MSCKSKWCHIYAVILPIHLVHRPLKDWSLVCEVSVQQIENNINRWRTYRIQIVFIIVKSIFCKGPCKLCLRCRVVFLPTLSLNITGRLSSKWQYFTVTKYFDWKVVINSNKAVSDYSSPSPVQLIKGIIHLSNSKRTSKTLLYSCCTIVHKLGLFTQIYSNDRTDRQTDRQTSWYVETPLTM